MFYTFEHPSTLERVDIEQSMNDEHVYVDDYGVEWNRIFYSPQVYYSDKIDPWSAKQFMEKTGGEKQPYGDLLTRSTELSNMRAEKNGGVDPMKVKAEENYSKERLNRKLPKKFKDLDVTVKVQK